MMRYHRLLAVLLPLCGGCVVTSKQIDPTSELAEAKVRPGITVLLRDSMQLIRGKRIGLLTNQTGIDENGSLRHRSAERETSARRGRHTRPAFLAGARPARDGRPRRTLPAGSMRRADCRFTRFTAQQTVAPPDSMLRALDALVFDLQDIGTRTWTYVGAMVYSMRASARVHKPIIVLDRPNPITGYIIEGPVLDSSLANPNDPAPGDPARRTHCGRCRFATG